MLRRTGMSYGFISIAGGGRRKKKTKKKQKVSNGLCKWEWKICFMLLLFFNVVLARKTVNFIIVFLGDSDKDKQRKAGIELSENGTKVHFALLHYSWRECYIYYFVCINEYTIYIFFLRLSCRLLNVLSDHRIVNPFQHRNAFICSCVIKGCVIKWNPPTHRETYFPNHDRTYSKHIKMIICVV